MKTPLEWMNVIGVVSNPTSVYMDEGRIAAIQADARQDVDDARKEAAKTLVQLGKVEDQRDEALSTNKKLDIALHDVFETLTKQKSNRGCHADGIIETALTAARLYRKFADERKDMVPAEHLDEALGILRVLQPQVKMWLSGSSEYEWIGKLLEGRFGEGIYKPK